MFTQEDEYNLQYQYKLGIYCSTNNEALEFKYNDEADFTKDLSIIKKLINN